MTVTLDSCTTFGQILIAISTLAFITFIFCVVAFDYNEREGWKAKSIEKGLLYFLPLYYPKESIKLEYVSWYPIYKFSFMVTASSVLLLLIGSGFGEFCDYSKS